MNEHKELPWTEQYQLVMPFYLMCDTSFSMSGNIAGLNDEVKRFRRTIVSEPVVDDVVQICIITYSDIAKVVLPLSYMSESNIPTFSAEGGTNYGAAFRLLAQTIERDVANLKGQGYKVYRPCAFFLTDGEPNDQDWYQTFVGTLTYDRQTGRGMKAHPIFIPFGFRDAPDQVLRRLAYPPERAKWYHARHASIDQAVKGILYIIMSTVLASGQSAQTGQPGIPQALPIPDSGIEYGLSEYDPDYHD